MDSNNRPSKIILRGMEDEHYDEALAAATLKPGYLAQLNSDGKLVAHSTSGGWGETIIITDHCQVLVGLTLDSDYASGDLASYHHCVNGDLVQVWLADGEIVVKGDKLISNGDGTFIKTTGTPTKTFGVAEEALDLSGVSNTAAQRIIMRVGG